MLKIKSFEFNPIQENTYIVYNELGECVIIDPGCYFEDEKDELMGFIQEMDLKPVLLLNTHCHLDHVFGNKFIADKFNLKLNIHPFEKTVLEFAPVSGLTYNIPFDNYTGELVFLEEDGTIKLGNDELKILFTPGHSPGSVSFYSEKQQFVISGDVLFYRSIGRTDLPGGDHMTLLKSIREKLFVLPGATRVYSGHGPSTTIDEELRLNPFFN
jgi:hydroxyacylglutathione hydrolase